MGDYAEIVIAAFLVLAGAFGLVGSFGLLKLGNTMQRLHGPTKATTLGVGGVLIASMLHALLIEGRLSFHELMITAFLFLTAPITAHFMAHVHVNLHENRDELPKTGSGSGWSVFERAPNAGRDAS